MNINQRRKKERMEKERKKKGKMKKERKMRKNIELEGKPQSTFLRKEDVVQKS